ncbi:ABC transporter ATP-binding protein [Cyclobacterium marinum]|uniref:ABC transporter related protein n=1 Tax=Cyclobacterium marinum (strain ATCC 25205 / DSM 745 / LMG 13164 / NCIMB 1802) TaxID=880070 RepID=G0IV97_CYCMS|nr:ABC transporter ATP-binding protein [Cyclobacterium marinum]AEL27896.1 ABC transporter related protein [Cyclobacterium marinum DSM 745]MBR9775762.1 ABC transporter ATP-binding protein [Cytophagales bacterium]
MENIISLEHVTKKFEVGDGYFTALNDVSLSFKTGEFAGFVGPSGSGKTTLLNIIGSLDSPTDGKAMVMGKDIAILSHKASANLRNLHIGFIFQVFNLLPVYTVFENVEFALLLQDVPKETRKKEVMEALDWVGLEKMAHKKPDKLSGGEGQRVAIARAMVKKPKILLADEPTANLDSANAHAILKTMKNLNKELGTTFLFSTHDEKVMTYLDRTVSLKDGKVVSDVINSQTFQS